MTDREKIIRDFGIPPLLLGRHDPSQAMGTLEEVVLAADGQSIKGIRYTDLAGRKQEWDVPPPFGIIRKLEPMTNKIVEINIRIEGIDLDEATFFYQQVQKLFDDMKEEGTIEWEGQNPEPTMHATVIGNENTLLQPPPVV